MLLKLIVVGLAVLVGVLRYDDVKHLYFLTFRPVSIPPEEDQLQSGYFRPTEKLLAEVPKRFMRKSKHPIV